MVLHTIENQFYSDIVTGFEEHARKNDFTRAARGDQTARLVIRAAVLRSAVQDRWNGVATFIPTSRPPRSTRSPIEYRSSRAAGAATRRSSQHVCIDNEKAVMDLMRHLIQLGTRAIAALNGNFPERTYERERERGYRRAGGGGHPLPRGILRRLRIRLQGGLRRGRQLMALPERPRRWFALADDRAHGIVKFPERERGPAGRGRGRGRV